MELIVDQLESCWSRLWIDVEAETKEEAVEKYKKGDYIVTESEVLDWTGDIQNEVIMDEDYNYLEKNENI